MQDLINNSDIDNIHCDIQLLKNNISSSDSSRRVTYVNIMNPSLSVHDIYTKRCYIYESHRVAFTRFRVSSHSLAIETGRWNR